MNGRVFYYAGILSPALYLIADLIGGAITPGFSYVRNAVSELFERGAENAHLLSPILLLSAISTLIFSAGILTVHPYSRHKLIFAGGALILVNGAINCMTATVFPQDPIGGEVTVPGALHLVLVGLAAVLMFPTLLIMATGLKRDKGWKNFRIFSLVILVVIVVGGFMTPATLAAGMEVMGVTERWVVYTYQLWVVVLAAGLIRDGMMTRTQTNTSAPEDTS